MKCKYCGNKMDLDHAELTFQGQVSTFICTCGASCTVHENLEETEWERDFPLDPNMAISCSDEEFERHCKEEAVNSKAWFEEVSKCG